MSLYYKDWGSGRPGATPSQGMIDSFWPQGVMGGPHGVTDTHKDRLNADLLVFIRS